MSASIHVRGVGTALPNAPLTNSQLEELVGPLPADVLDGLQVQQRHWIIDPQTGAHQTTNSSLAARAASSALQHAELAPNDIGLVVVSTASPEYHLPTSSGLVLEHLGISSAITIDVRAGCAGFIQALDTARLHMLAGNIRFALVIGVEVISPLIFPIYDGKYPHRIRMRDRIGAYTFGDGAGAVLLERVDSEDPEEARWDISRSAQATVGGQKKPGMEIVGGGTYAPIHEQVNAKQLVRLTVDVVESGRFIPQMLTQSIEHFLTVTEQTPEDIDLMIIPEGNAGYVTSELEAAGLATPVWRQLENKVYENIASVAATGSAAVPLALADAIQTGRIKHGDNVALLAIETSKWIYGALSFRWGR